MPELQGRRRYRFKGGNWLSAKPGDYWFVVGKPKQEGRVLWIRDPFGHFGRCPQHEITEHVDGTVTVNPSILDDRGVAGDSFHGWLREGVWSW